jgi:predicted nucleic acid-binding protein
MSTVLLDTNIVSFVFRRDTRAAAYAPLLQGNRLAISFMTAAELFQWANARKWGQPRFERLDQAIATYLDRFARPRPVSSMGAVARRTPGDRANHRPAGRLDRRHRSALRAPAGHP